MGIRDNPTPPNVFYGQYSFYVTLSGISVADVVTNYTPAFPGSITNFYFITGTTPVSTGSKTTTQNLEIGSVNLQGGSLVLTSAGSDTIGEVTASTAIGGSNNFGRSDTISVECSAATAFIEGDGYFVVEYRGDVQQSETTSWETSMYPNTFHTTMCIPMLLANITGNVDIATTFVPGFVGWFKKISFVVGTVATTPAKLASINLEIGSTNVTGGVVALTSANCGTLGAVISGSAITGANLFDKDDTISLEASSVTPFIEGAGTFIIEMEGPVM